MTQEQAFLTALASVTAYRIGGDQLELLTLTRAPVLVSSLSESREGIS